MDLMDYWGDNPPMHLMVKHFMGIKDHEPVQAAHRPSEPELRQLLRSLAHG